MEYGKFDPSVNRKTTKDIEKPSRIYHYVAELSCRAKFDKNRLTHFGYTNRGSFSFFSYKHTIRQTIYQTILSSCVQITNIEIC